MSKQAKTIRRESPRELIASETYIGDAARAHALPPGELRQRLIERLRGIASDAITDGGGDPADWWTITREGDGLTEKWAGANVLSLLSEVETYLALSDKAATAKAAHGYGKMAVEKALALPFYVHALTIVENEPGIAPWVKSFAHGRRGGEAKRTKYAERDIHMARKYLEERPGTRLSEPKLKEKIGKKGNWKPDPSEAEGWLPDGTGVGKSLGPSASIDAINNGLRALGKL